MKDLTEELLSFDRELLEAKNLMLQKSAEIRSKADEEYEKVIDLKKEELSKIQQHQKEELTDYLDTIEMREKEKFTNLKEHLKNSVDLSSHIEEIVTVIKKDLAKEKKF